MSDNHFFNQNVSLKLVQYIVQTHNTQIYNQNTKLVQSHCPTNTYWLVYSF